MAEGERRPVTILFTDIVGSTAIAERLDPEEWREVVSGAHRRVSEAVVRYEGTIAQLLGDGVLAFFGAPAAHEDDPSRAVRAALDIQAAIAVYARELAGYVDDFAMRIGIHTGEVVVGEIGSAAHAEYLAVGDAVNLAARLQSAAAPGKVLVSERVARLVRGSFELAGLGEITVKGKAAPVAAFEVLGQRAAKEDERRKAKDEVDAPSGLHDAARPRLAGWFALHAPLVGRESELAVLAGALEGLCAGHGGIVWLLGEAGIGKSRLVEEAHAWAHTHLCRPPHWLEGRAVSYGAGLPYWTITQLLKADLGLSDGDPEVRARVALRRRTATLFGAAAGEASPYLARLLGLRLEGEDADRVAGLDSEALRYQILVSLRRYFAALADRAPLVLVCDDLHWADPSTLDSLSELLALTDHAPLLLVLVARTERGHGSWRLRQRAETEYAHRYAEIALRPLAESESSRLVDNLLAAQEGGGEVTSPLRRLLLDRAEGNPFYLEELVASLLEQGVLVRDGDDWRVQGSLESLNIPDTVQGIILARLDRLEEDVRGTLQMASVIGRSFLYRLLQAVAEAERQLDRHMVVLQRADLVREKAVRPELEYMFKHSLAQEAAYHSLLAERRREFHRRVGEGLERLFPDRQEEFCGLLAHHFDRAEQAEKAVHYLIAAGDKARLGDTLPEAARFYRRAVERLEAAGDAKGASRAWLKLALVRQSEFDFAAAHEAYERGFAWEQRAPRRTVRPADESRVLRWSTPFPADSLDPGRVYSLAQVMLVQQVFAGLADIDTDLNVLPHAARSWEVRDDGLRYLIHLRPDVCWTDGSPVTAHDYAYAWLRNLDPRVAAAEYPASLLDDVLGARAYRLGQLRDATQVGVRGLDDLTLEVRLERPLAYFPYLLALWITYPLPRTAIERWGDAWWQPEHIISNGAYRLVQFEPERVVLEHNPRYFGERTGNVAQAHYLAIADQTERLARFRSGELDRAVSFGMPDDLAPCLERSLDLDVWCFVLAPQPPLDDPRVRRALAAAVDWGRPAQYRAANPATGGLISPGMPGHTPGLALPHDPEQAHRLLAEAGYPAGRGLPTIHIRSWSRLPEVGAAAARLLQEALPVEVELHQIGIGDMGGDLTGMHLVFDAWLADLPDPDNILRQGEVLRILRRAGWQDPELDALLERAAHTPDRVARMALYRKADRRLVAEEALVLPLVYGPLKELRQPWVGGARANKMDYLSLKDLVVAPH